MRIVVDPVADGISDGRLAEMVVPLHRGELAGDDGGARAVAVLEDLEHVAALTVSRRCQAPVVDDQHVGLGQLCEEARVGAIRRADVVQPVTAVQSEYSLWTRDPEATKVGRLEENLGAANVELLEQDLNEIESELSRIHVTGARLPEPVLVMTNR